MSTSAFTNALIATARLTGVAGLALSVAGCPKPPEAGSSSTPADAQVAPAAAESAQPAAPSSQPALTADACKAVFEQELAGIDYGDYAERQAELAAAASAEAVACCQSTVARPEDRPRWGCCAVDPKADMMACTPWGPPAPPRMVGHAVAA